MPAKIRSLSDIADIIMGQSPSGEACNTKGEGIPLLNGPTEFGSQHPTPEQFTTTPKKIAQPGDILFCVRGSTTGRMNIADREYAIGRGLAALRHKKGKAFQPFLKAIIEINLPILLAAATGSTFPNVSRAQLMSLNVTLPSDRAQHAISQIVGSLDDKIALNSRINETLEALARALFKSWFVDFDPVRAKMKGRQPADMNAATAALFPDRLVDSEAGLIPDGWTIGPLELLTEINPPEKIQKGTLAPYTEMKDLSENTASTTAPTLRPFSSGSKFRNGDTLLARITPCLENGKTALVDNLPANTAGWGSTEFIVIRPKKSVPTTYPYILARSEHFRTHAIKNMTGTSGRQRVPADTISNYQAVIPPLPILSTFGAITTPLFQRITMLVRETTALSKTRDTLLPKLISGELSVTEAENQLGIDL